jgi:hypothetical protein
MDVVSTGGLFSSVPDLWVVAAPRQWRVPPGASKGKDTRYIGIHEGDELDEAQMVTCVKQAAALSDFLGPRP